MKPISVLIVDDEPPARERLKDLLAQESHVKLEVPCTGGQEAVRAIRKNSPDLVFLDVQMPKMSGLDVLRNVGPDEMPVVIFVTAYDRYALDAFEMAAVDYLLKPYEDERFVEALERARRQVRLQERGDLSRKMSNLLEEMRHANHASAGAKGGYLERLAVEHRGRMLIVPVGDIRYFAADGTYIKVHTESGGAHLIRQRLKTLETRLDGNCFCRIHRSTIVNMAYVKAVKPRAEGGCVVELRDGTQLKISRSRSREAKRRLGVLR